MMAETNDSKIVVLQNPDDLSLLWDDLLSVEVADGQILTAQNIYSGYNGDSEEFCCFYKNTSTEYVSVDDSIVFSDSDGNPISIDEKVMYNGSSQMHSGYFVNGGFYVHEMLAPGNMAAIAVPIEGTTIGNVRHSLTANRTGTSSGNWSSVSIGKYFNEHGAFLEVANGEGFPISVWVSGVILDGSGNVLGSVNGEYYDGLKPGETSGIKLLSMDAAGNVTPERYPDAEQILCFVNIGESASADFYESAVTVSNIELSVMDHAYEATVTNESPADIVAAGTATFYDKAGNIIDVAEKDQYVNAGESWYMQCPLSDSIEIDEIGRIEFQTYLNRL